MTSSRSRARIVGMAGGTLWLIAASTGFAIVSLLWIGTPTARGALAAVVGLAALFIGVTIRAMLAARRMVNASPARTDERKIMMRRFTVIVVAEVLGIMVVNALCGFYRQYGLMAPLDIIVVGLHFLALARLFQTPRYTVMGWLFCAIPIAVMLSYPEQALVGRAQAWFVVSSLLCDFVVWLTAAANLREIFQMTHGVDAG
jgi:hypothetical protein